MTLFLLGVAAALGLVIYMWVVAHMDRVVDVTIRNNRLPGSFSGFKVYFISDVHRRRINEEMLEAVKKRQPNIIVIGGDITNRGIINKTVFKNIDKLTSMDAPVFFVPGNHDYKGNMQNLEQILRQYGVKIIKNTALPIYNDSESIQLIGVDDTTTEHDCLKDALAAASPGYRILFSHNPLICEQLTPNDKIAFVVSGHTHGGQIRLFGWGPRENGGVKHKKFGTLVISNGYGTTQFPLRLGAYPDTLFITLDKG